MPRASQQRSSRHPTLKNFFQSNLNFKGFHKVNRIIERTGTTRDTSEIITFGKKDPESTGLFGPDIALKVGGGGEGGGRCPLCKI